MLRCRYRSAQEVQQRFSRKYQDSSAGRKSRSGSGSRSRSRCGRGTGAEVLVLVQWCWCREVVQSRRKGAEVQNGKQRCRGVEVLRC